VYPQLSGNKGSKSSIPFWTKNNSRLNPIKNLEAGGGISITPTPFLFNLNVVIPPTALDLKYPPIPCIISLVLLSERGINIVTGILKANFSFRFLAKINAPTINNAPPINQKIKDNVPLSVSLIIPDPTTIQ